MIEEPIIGPLAYKGLVSNPEGNVFISPSQKHFIWPRSGLVNAHCDNMFVHYIIPGQIGPVVATTVADEYVHYDYGREPIPAENCHCGIYGTFNWNDALNYMQMPSAVLVLIEACGNWITGDMGRIRCEQARVIAALSHYVIPDRQQYHRIGDLEPNPLDLLPRMDPRLLMAEVAAEYFGVEVFSMQAAREAMQIQNTQVHHLY
jgi:hypothetical protein